MRKLGYKSFRDMYRKIKERNSKKEPKIDTESRRKFTILEINNYNKCRFYCYYLENVIL